MGQSVKPETKTKVCEQHGEYEVAGLDFGDGEIRFLGGCPGCVAEADSARERMRAEEERWQRERKLRQLQATDRHFAVQRVFPVVRVDQGCGQWIA